MAKIPKGFRLSADAERLLIELASRNGLSQAAQVEMLIRNEAERRGIKSEELKK